MRYRHTALTDAETATTAATKIQDIDLAEPVSRLLVEIKGTNSSATPTAHGAKMVSKIELVDGSDVLYSLSGIESQAMTYYGTKRLPFMVNEFRNDVMNIQTFELNFGRYLWDPDLALLPNKFKNLQLKITHNKANGGSAPDAATMSIFADIFDEKGISPRGFLQSKEHFTFTLTSSAHEYIDLPVDYPLRQVIIQSLAADKQPHEQFNKVKLYEEDGKKVVIDTLATSDLCKILRPRDPITEEICGTGTGSAVQHFVTPAYETYVTTLGFDAATTTNYCNQSYGGDATIAFDNAEHFQGHVIGLCPHGALALPFGMPDDIGDWYDVTKLGNLKLDLTAGSSVGSSSTCEILTQQFRRY